MKFIERYIERKLKRNLIGFGFNQSILYPKVFSMDTEGWMKFYVKFKNGKTVIEYRNLAHTLVQSMEVRKISQVKDFIEKKFTYEI